MATRQDVEANLFSDPKLTYTQAVEFYKHDVNWRNRLILGDSLQVMASLAKREDLAGKVQMIYIDPPYGIKYPSNFQPEVGKRYVKENEADLTREPEMVKAYRDTWHLGIHSYLSYLRDRLHAARELLADTGSIFFQIGDENVHLARNLLDEVFGRENSCSIISYSKTTTTTGKLLPGTTDYILWYAKDITSAKYRQVYLTKVAGSAGATKYDQGELLTGERACVSDSGSLGAVRLFTLDNITSPRIREGRTGIFSVAIHGTSFLPQQGEWKTNRDGMRRLTASQRIEPMSKSLRYVRYLDDFSAVNLANTWMDIGGIQSRTDPKIYVVQTSGTAISRCMLMTTDPGDLVLDPTCGSGTTGYVAEQWGRRWIAIDTSRVAIAIARQRLLTAKYDYYQLKHDPKKPVDSTPSPSQGFMYKTVPHVTLKSIAQNQNLDPIFAKHEPILDAALIVCNAALGNVSAKLRETLAMKLKEKEAAEGKRAVTDADRRRWQLPEKFEHWTVPFDTDANWPADLRQAVEAYRLAWRAKMDAVNECIARNAEQEELVDKPILDTKIRVSGPFTVEGVQPPEIALSEVTQIISPIGGAPEKLAGTFRPAMQTRIVERRNEFETANIPAYLDNMTQLLRGDGVRFLNNKPMTFSRLLRCQNDKFHAEGRWVPMDDKDDDPNGDATVAVVFGPQYGPMTVKMVEPLIKHAARKYDALVLAAFSFAAEVSELAQSQPHPDLKIHLAHISPDVNPGMNGLLKQQPKSQLFTVFGAPRTRLESVADGEFVVHMEGVDIYDPVNNVIRPTDSAKVAAWFLDGDYDGKTFCITQAFFPDKGAWEKLAKALGGKVDPERFAALSGTVSLPFPAGEHGKAAVKVIDPRGNEVMRVHTLPGGGKMSAVPIQPVENPIICPPFDEPADHWIYDKETGVASRAGKRRPGSYYFKTKRTGTKDLFSEVSPEETFDTLPLVNMLREDVKRWREAEYRGATPVTKELLKWWASPKRDRRLFFCQREAIETVIYLAELRMPGKSSRTGFKQFSLTDENLRRLLADEKMQGVELSDEKFWPKLVDQPDDPNLLSIRRLGCKMATGSGKTVVMALLISWAFCNRGANPESTEFPNAVLVCAPNLTVKERLQVLRPENPDNYYLAFDLVPVNLRPYLQAGKVLVENWHKFAPESEHKEGDKSYTVVNKGPETPETLARRVLGDLYDRLPIMVLNDEGHHCWRPAPVPYIDDEPEEPRVRGRKKKVAEEDAFAATEEEAVEARVWLQGLDFINNCLLDKKPGIALCLDLSATPFYLQGSGYPEGQPFPWLVSDFGLVDAIESGIVKIPRLPIKDDSGKKDEAGRPDPKYFRLWHHIVAAMKPHEKLGSGKPKPEPCYREAEGALALLAGQWKEKFEHFQDATANHERIPPVMILVCDNTDIADYFYRKKLAANPSQTQ